MFFLIRTAFWISLLLLVLPFGGALKSDGPSAEDRASIDAMSALAAAGATVSDVGGFCTRQPDACAVGGQALKVVGERARDGAAALQDYFAKDAKGANAPEAKVLDAKALDPKPAGKDASRTTGSVPAAGRHTLTPADRKAAWRNPAA